MRPFFTFFGGKYRAAPRYPRPKHKIIIEPFAGSAGYALRYPHHWVWINDIDPIIAGLWSYLVKVRAEEIRKLPIAVQHVSEVKGPPEARYLIGFWLNKGMTAPCNVPSKWMRDGWRPNSQWGEVIRERIASQVDVIRHWRVTNRSYSELPGTKATWFVDPPYEVSGRRYRYRDIDYEDLGRWCRQRRGQLMVCEQEGAEWLPFRPFGEFKALEGKYGAKRSTEMLYYRARLPRV